MTTPLKSILVTEWSERHLAGHDLNGGRLESFNLATAVDDIEALKYDTAHWSVGDIATLRFDPEAQCARLRVVTPRSYVVRVRDFEIVDIVTHHAAKDCGRHIFLKGSAQNGATYVMPMLGYTAWDAPWNFADLLLALNIARMRQGETSLAYDFKVIEVGGDGEQLQQHIDAYNDIFYPGSKEKGTVFDRATSLTVTSLMVKHDGSATRAQMLSAAFVKKPKPCDRTEEAETHKSGTSFSPPYFEVDGEKVFIRTC